MAAGFMTHVTCRLTAKYWDQLRNPTLGDRVWAAFTFLHRLPRPIAIDVASSGVCVRHAEEPIVSRLGEDLSENHVCRLGPGAEWESAMFTETVDSSSSRARRGRPIRHSSDAAYRYHYRSSLLLLGADAARLVAVHCREPVYDCHLSLSLSISPSLSFQTYNLPATTAFLFLLQD